MKKMALFLIILFFLIQPIFSLQPEIRLFSGLGQLSHPVSTQNEVVQKFFNQGLTFLYAFNHDAAFSSFKKAVDIEPTFAMGYWGMAISVGQNINRDINQQRMLEAYQYIQKALLLISKVTDNEAAYIQALAQRYTHQSNPDFMALRIAYKKAMEQVMLAFPEDLDAATLYAESAMNLKPWRLWSNDYKPAQGTLEVVQVLESVLKRDPMHIGANHYYIHAIEGSAHPEYALMSAKRLETMLPASGHFLHMPSHIYLLVGDYTQAAISNEKAIQADWQYIREYGLKGFYPIHYLSHNYFMLSRAYLMMGRFEDSLKTALELHQFYIPHFAHMPEIQYYALNALQVLMFFHKWEEILAYPAPESNKLTTKAFWHFARAMAFANLNQKNQSLEEKSLFLDIALQIPAEQMLGNNEAKVIFQIAELLLDAKFAKMEQNFQKMISFLEKAVHIQDLLHYNEPPDWFFPIRQLLATEQLLLGNSGAAYQIYKKDLNFHPRNPYSLFGLYHCLFQLNKKTDALWVREEFQKAWQNSTVYLSMPLLSL